MSQRRQRGEQEAATSADFAPFESWLSEVDGWPELTSEQRHALARALAPHAGEEATRARVGLVAPAA